MGRIQQSKELRPALAAAAVFLCTGLSIASMFLIVGRAEVTSGYWPATMAITNPLISLFASVLVFLRPSLGYVLGGISAVVALPWFALTESSDRPSVWTCLNGPDEFAVSARPYAAVRILSVALIAATFACSLLRVLPSGLLLRNYPL